VLGAWNGTTRRPLRALRLSPDGGTTTFRSVPDERGTSNLLLPAERLMATAAGASLRVMGTAFATGQAAGVAPRAMRRRAS